VRAGQPLIRLDDRDFRAAVDRAAAIVEARKATLDSLERKQTLQQTAIRQAKADLDAKQAQAAFAKQDDQRYRDLAQTSAGSRQNAERASSLNLAAEASVVSSAAGLDGAKQQLTVLGAEIAVAKADVAQAEADLSTRLNLISVTLIFAIRLTAMSAIAPLKSAPMSLAAPISPWFQGAISRARSTPSAASRNVTPERPACPSRASGWSCHP
jgi:multidrug resistance efflux pump